MQQGEEGRQYVPLQQALPAAGIGIRAWPGSLMKAKRRPPKFSHRAPLPYSQGTALRGVGELRAKTSRGCKGTRQGDVHPQREKWDDQSNAGMHHHMAALASPSSSVHVPRVWSVQARQRLPVAGVWERGGFGLVRTN